MRLGEGYINVSCDSGNLSEPENSENNARENCGFVVNNRN